MGYILRDDGLQNDIMDGKFEGQKPRGRKRKSMLYDVPGEEEDGHGQQIMEGDQSMKEPAIEQNTIVVVVAIIKLHEIRIVR